MVKDLPFVAAAVIGNRVSDIPPGTYWIVEWHYENGIHPPLFWMDDYDREGRTGFAYVPQKAALFRSAEDARRAWAARGTGQKAVFNRTVMRVVEHAWE